MADKDKDVIEGEVVSRSLALNTRFGREVILPAANLKYLEELPPGAKRRDYIKTRTARGGGNVQYTGWTNSADFLDTVFGPGQWGLELVEYNKSDPRQKSDEPTKMVVQYAVHCRLHAEGLLIPTDCWGHGEVWLNDINSNESDAIESGMSRALSKGVARISRLLRSVWGKDDETIQAITTAPVTQVNASIMAIRAIKNLAGGREDVEKMIEAALKRAAAGQGLDGYEDAKLKRLTAQELQVFNREVAEIMDMIPEEQVEEEKEGDTMEFPNEVG